MREENKGTCAVRGREECGETKVEGVDYGNSDLKLLTPNQIRRNTIQRYFSPASKDKNNNFHLLRRVGEPVTVVENWRSWYWHLLCLDCHRVGIGSRVE